MLKKKIDYRIYIIAALILIIGVAAVLVIKGTNSTPNQLKGVFVLNEREAHL